MKNKKGFTLVEIIVALALITLISAGGVGIVSSYNKKNEERNNALIDSLIKAASVYINLEKDEQGNTYENGLYYGGTGVFIPIQELHDKGYIDGLKNKIADYRIISDILKRNLENEEFMQIQKTYEQELYRKLGASISSENTFTKGDK